MIAESEVDECVLQVEVRENLLVKMININNSFRFTKNVYHSYTCFNQKIVLLCSTNMDTL